MTDKPVVDKSRIDSLTSLLDEVQAICEGDDEVTVGSLQEVAGRQTTAPLLIIPGLVLVSPLSGIPTVPTLIGLIISLVSIQLLISRTSIWLPRKLRSAGISAHRAQRTIKQIRPIAKVLDRVTKRRLESVARPLGGRAVGLIGFLIALSLPVMEFIPFSSSLAGLVVALFGLGLLTDDGLLLLLAFMAFGLCLIAAMSFLLM